MQTEGFHVSRTFGSDSYYRATYVDIDAGIGAGKETGEEYYLSVQPPPMGRGLSDVYGW